MVEKQEVLIELFTSTDSTRPGCLFGVKCYRRNPQHFRDYEHPHVQELCREFPGANDDIPKERLLAFDVAEEVVREQMAVIRKQIQTQPSLKRSNSDSDSNAREAPKKMAPPKQMSIDKKLGWDCIIPINRRYFCCQVRPMSFWDFMWFASRKK